MLTARLLQAISGAKTFLINVNSVDVNLFAIAGSPTKKGKFRFIVLSGVVVGHINAVAAMSVGQFPAGSQIELINYGSIQGKGGAAGIFGTNNGLGGKGGDSLYTAYVNQTVRITNYGEIKAGGGGGGAGGAGGRGGDGGRGNITSTSDWQFFQIDGGGTEWVNHYNTNIIDALWYPQSFRGGSSNPTNGINMLTPIGVLDRGDQVGTGDDNNGLGPYTLHKTRLNTLQAGGVGGATRAGGTGGFGAGYNQIRTFGQTGEQSTPGTDPGNGAGKAGQSGNAGKGGDGSDWGGQGTLGNKGNDGWDGNAGTAGGFNENGALGTPGADPSAAGSAGRAIVKGSSNITLIDNGTIIGAIVAGV